MRSRSSVLRILLLILVLATAIVILALAYGASLLRFNTPEHSDVIVVLGGGSDDSRFWRAVELTKAGYSDQIMLDAEAFSARFGKTDADLARDFLSQINAQNTTVCPVYHDSTYGEVQDVARCLEPRKVSSVLLVTSDYHTRRAFSIFKARLPKCHWSIAASYAPYEAGTSQRMAGDDWWRNRRWAKTTLDEWEKLIWWWLVDRWRSNLVLQR
jgi:uncharacterized SAM-binding protein YcdF (DUF218 family)